MIQEINTIQDVETFINDIAKEMPAYNPFEDFYTFIDPETGKLKYTYEEATVRTRLVDSCFDLCALQEVNFIVFALELMLEINGNTAK